MSVSHVAPFPFARPRRLRQAAWARAMVAEYRLRADDLVWPVFVREGSGEREPVASMPGVFRYSIDVALEEIASARSLGLRAVALFPVTPESRKDASGSEALRPTNLMCRAIAAVRDAMGGELGIVADVALDPYTSHGQDGLVVGGKVDNDRTLEVLAAQAVLQAQAGADIVAPSDMMDGRVARIRRALDGAGLSETLILSYAAKYASSFYGPFRDAVGSKVSLGAADKRTYQMDPANAAEALREVALDVAEGADLVMVKPGMPYLDIVARVKTTFGVPTVAYQVSGEYAMLRTAADLGRLVWREAMLESLVAFRRAGADAVFTYAAPEVLSWLREAS